jgi:sigma-B regulation protein RsbU (phosphoserine phosphatase)
MNFIHRSPAPRQEVRHPHPPVLPSAAGLNISACYRAARIGGDFYDFVELGHNRLLFVLLDIAGKKEDTLNIAAAAQDVLRHCGQELLGHEDLNVADVLTDLLLDINRAILAAANGVRCAPAFLGCYESEFGLLHYCNAGHTPGFIRDDSGLTLLESNGLPLGLFSHATHDAQVSALGPGAALVLVSKGLVEARSGRHEFGIDGVKQVLRKSGSTDADQLCSELLRAVEKFEQAPTHFGPQLHVPGFRSNHEPNDSTVLALMRAQFAAVAVAG